MDIRRLVSSDRAAWAALIAVSFGRSQADMLHTWDWLHAGYKIVAWGAWDKTQLVAQYSCLVSNVLLPQPDELAQVGISTNMAVHPDFRGRGLIKQVAQPVYEELKASCIAGVGFSNSAGVQVDKHSQSYGYRVVGKMLSRLIWPLSRFSCDTVLLTTAWPELPWNYAPPKDGLVRFNATPSLVRHRYAAHPFRQFRFGIWQSGQEIRGLVIDRPIKLGGVPGVSLLAAYANELPDLLRYWSNTIRLSGARFIHFLTTPASPLLASARSLGVCWSVPYSRSPHYLTVKPLQEQMSSLLLDFGRWDCYGGNIL